MVVELKIPVARQVLYHLSHISSPPIDSSSLKETLSKDWGENG
jgi:hypothetical protein